MLDIKFIRENKDLVADGARKKHLEFDVDRLITVDDDRRALLAEIEAMRARQNDASTRMAQAAPGERVPLLSELKDLKEELQTKEVRLKEIVAEWQTLMVRVPNIPDMSVPEGEDDQENKEVRAWGTPREFPFAPKSHLELMQKNGTADFERGTKIAGFRGYVLKGDAARLSFALWQFALDELMRDGFEPFIVPSLVRRETLMGTGYLPQGEEDLYKTQDGDYLAGTAEVATMGYFMDDTLSHADLPKKIVAFSPCFRREAGSHGKDTKGLIRVHEFYKLEQIVLVEANHEESVRFHELLTQNAERLMQKLQIPYRVVVNCGGDLGLGQVKKYDIESWMPSQKTYRETHSASYFHDFQTRRLNIRYRDADGKLKFAHSLNNTLVATPRLLAAVAENFQEEDGSVRVPAALAPYLNRSSPAVEA